MKLMRVLEGCLYSLQFFGYLSNKSNICRLKLGLLYFDRSRSRSYSPSHSRRHGRGSHADDGHRSKSRAPKIEYITEFGGSGGGEEPKLEGYSPPPSPLSQADALNRSEHLTFNICKKIDWKSLYCAAAYHPFCYLRKLLWFSRSSLGLISLTAGSGAFV